MSANLLQLVKKPSAGSVNTGLTSLSNAWLLQRFGNPRASYSSSCQSVTNSSIKKHILTLGVGPFRVTGYDIALWSLQRIFQNVLKFNKPLYSILGTAGMLCARYMRGSHTQISDHSWGFAIDVKLSGVLDRRGDNLVQQGMIDLYHYFRNELWYWGAEYNVEDAMHFSVSRELLTQYL